jgi:hypothetical protein
MSDTITCLVAYLILEGMSEEDRKNSSVSWAVKML